MTKFLRSFAHAALFAIIAVAATTLLFGGLVDSWEADDCARLDRQNRNGYPVDVPEWCDAHGFEPRVAPANR